MRNDLIIGLLCSVLLHLGMLFGENLFPKGKVEKQAKRAEEQLIQMTPPPEEPPEEEDVHELNEEPQQNQLAPPTLVDMPSIVPVNAFTQPIQPPPPPGLTADKGQINIPVVKPGTQFGKGMKDLFRIEDLDQKPEPRVQPPPQYPFEMKRAGITGEVTIEYIVDSNGNVNQVQVIKSTQREFENAVTQAVLKWKFKPGKKGGRAVNTRVAQSFPFTLTED